VHIRSRRPDCSAPEALLFNLFGKRPFPAGAVRIQPVDICRCRRCSDRPAPARAAALPLAISPSHASCPVGGAWHHESGGWRPPCGGPRPGQHAQQAALVSARRGTRACDRAYGVTSAVHVAWTTLSALTAGHLRQGEARQACSSCVPGSRRVGQDGWCKRHAGAAAA